MLSDAEQDALTKLKAYLDAGHSLDDIREVGWASWIDHLEAKGFDVRTGRSALRPPDTLIPSPLTASKEPPRKTGGSKGLRPWQVGALIVGGLVVVLVIVGAALGDGGSTSVGSEARLYEDGLTAISVAFTEDAFDDMIDARVANDFAGWEEVLDSGRAVQVPNGTDVLVLERKFGKTEIRVLEGPYAGTRGSVPSDWVRGK